MKRILRLLILICLITFPSLVRASLTGTMSCLTGRTFCDTTGANAILSFSPTGGCAGTITVVRWVVTYPSGFISNSTSGSYVLNQFGAYNVKVVLSCSTGGVDSISSTGFINVNHPPIINFTTSSPGSDTILTCGPKIIHFVNTSNSDTASSCTNHWHWRINGAGGHSKDIYTSSCTDTFTAPGNYNVTLTYDNSPCGCFGSRVKTSYIQIQAPPTACFVRVTAPLSCSYPFTAIYSDTCSSSTATSFTWYFGDGTSTTTTGLGTVSHTFTSPGWYSDSVVAYSSAGCPASFAIDSDLHIPDPINHMASHVSTVCAGTCVDFADSVWTSAPNHDTTVGLPTFYLYNSSSTLLATAPSTNPGNFCFNFPWPDSAGTFTITDAAVDGYGCPMSTSTTINVLPRPIVTGISGDTLYQCTPFVVDLFHGSAHYGSLPYTYSWTFGDGASFTGVSRDTISHKYTSLGSYNVTLKIVDANGCLDSLTNPGMINISAPHLNITAAVDSGCATAGHPLFWDYNTSLARPFTPYIVDSVNFGDGTADCIGNTCRDSSHYFTGGGYYHVTVFYHLPDSLGGCSDTSGINVLVGGALPAYAFTQSADSVCPHSTVDFFAHCTNCTSVIWAMHSGDASHALDMDTADGTHELYDFPGRWTYQMIMNVGGCTDTLDSNVVVLPPARGIIAPLTPNCAHRDTVKFSILAATGATSYTWAFGDATSVSTTATSVIHHYTAAMPHTYTVICTSYSTVGSHTCSNDTSLVYTTGTPPLTWRIKDQFPCVNSVDSFYGPHASDTTAFPDYFWNFGDGSGITHTSYSTDAAFPQNDSLTSHAYTSTGIYTAYVIVRNSSGCRDTTATKTVRVLGPNGGMTLTDTLICVGSAVTFHDANTDPSAIITRPHHWTFNGYPSVPFPSTIPSTPLGVAATDTTINFYTPGYYHIVLVDSDNHQCASRATGLVHVVKPKTYFYSVDSAHKMCIGLPITFTDTNTHCSYSWNFGDAGTGAGSWTTPSSTAGTVTHTYSVNGTFNVRCAIFADGTAGYPTGCSDTLVRNAYITVGPLLLSSTNFGDDSVSACPPLHIVRSADTVGYSYVWHINPPGGSAGTFFGDFVSYNAYSSGHYSVTMIGTTPWGCSDSVVSNYTIGGPAGYITVTPDSGCNPIPVRLEFHDTGIVAASAHYIWNTCPFGTFATSGPDTTINFATSGVYCPPSVVIQNGGCAVTITYGDSLRVFPLPFVTLNHLPVLCYGRDTTLIASSTLAISHYHWDPPISDITYWHPTDSAFVTVHPHSTITYTVTGYTIHGCIDTETTTVVVDPQLHLTIHGRDSMCIGQCDTLVASGVAGASYIWSGVGTSCAVCDTNIVCITSTKTFTASATDAAGCSASNTFKVTVNPAPVIHFSPNPANICKGHDTTHLFVTGAAKYVWRSNHYLSCDSCSNPIVSTPANLVYTVTGTSKFGCIDSIKVPVTVFDTNATTISNDTSICKGSTANLYAAGGVKYQWLPTTGLDNPTSPRPNATPDVTTHYRVYITENVCFRDTQNVTVTVIPIPQIQLPPEVTVLAGTSVQLFASVLNNVKLTDFKWTPADSTLSCIECPRPIATPVVTTTYSVTVATTEGCATSGSTTIRILCDNSQVFIPNTFTPNGDGVNDRFFVSGRGLGKVTRMAIYNRWGEMIYESLGAQANDGGVGWDGTYKGQVLAPDVFIYRIDVLCSTGEPFSFKGDISLVR